ncbi:MAG TPA: hypothetical protein PK904_05800 [Bacteroidales bacterium]|nr:hypothetical protein [Bacteroidales bacterium]HPE55888.1 hypothetical protein [Bacteroidales bacterium]
MKKLILIFSLLAFIGVSCRSGKDNNIYVDHAKEKDHFRVNKQYKKSDRKCKTWR